MPGTSAPTWKTSRYTHTIPLQGGGLVYNGRTGAILELSGSAFRSARRLLDRLDGRTRPLRTALIEELLEHLIFGGFVIEASEDEVEILEREYERSRAHSKFLLTILPTFGCNLTCDYCFVAKKRGTMDAATCDRLVDFVKERLELARPPTMHVDWFGGEPLLALPLIQSLSARFLATCEELGIPYRAQVISNGTRVSPQVADALQQSGVDRVQITMDGTRALHDARRPFTAAGRSSFDRILSALPALLGRFLVRLRINVDRRNLDQVWDLLELFDEKGWLGPETRFFPYLERVAPWTAASSHVVPLVCTLDEFMTTQLRWLSALRSRGVPVLEQGLYLFPAPRSYTCGAVGTNGFLVTPDGELHKCGLEVDDSSRAVGHLGAPLDPRHPNQLRFDTYSPFADPACRECAFLPTCLGGCPKMRMERSALSSANNCGYFHKYELELLKVHLTRG